MAGHSTPPQSGLALDNGQPDRLQRWAPREWAVAEGWGPVIDGFLATEAGRRLAAFIEGRLAAGATIYPPRPFRALELTPLASVRAVVLGQDPYHGAGQAEGLAFSVPAGVPWPPSLRNIFRELGGSRSAPQPSDGSLATWARQGILLLNTCFTVEAGRPASHAKKGWEELSDAVLVAVATTASPCAYLLWGAHAQAKAGLIREHAARSGCDILLLRANHPSPLSARRPPAPFLGCGHFAQARDWLAARGATGFFAPPGDAPAGAGGDPASGRAESKAGG